MFPFWEIAIAPVLEAADARRVVEIGALRGENTVQMLDRLGPECELHVIDPVPDFDPAEHGQRFGGRYVFHQALSLDVLGRLPPMDAALIDGDHNWYTVFNELRLLSEVSEASGAPLPLLFLHDVGWPYGRRDLYYAPEQIPEEFRQPHRQAGMRLGRRKLFDRGSLNPTMHNAELEGGPRNGVMTALDDFIAGFARPVRLVEIPVYFGLAIVVEEALLAERPAIAAALDRIEAADGRLDLMEMVEEARLRSMTLQHHFVQTHRLELDRARARHLELLKSALLNEVYLDHEVALAHLTRRAAIGQPPFPERLRDPLRHDAESYRSLANQRSGPTGPDPEHASSFLPYTAMGRPRIEHLERCLEQLAHDRITGDLATFGAGRGGGPIFMRGWLDIHDVDGPAVFLFDEFRASAEPATKPALDEQGMQGLRADLNLVRDGFARFGLLDDRVRFVHGRLDETGGDPEIGDLALLWIGGSAAPHAATVLERFGPRVVEGGFIVVEPDPDGLNRPAAEAFAAGRRGLAGHTEIDAGAVSWRVVAAPDAKPAMPPLPSASPPLAAVAADDSIDLSIVVVFYNMRREAARTLRSLSRAYQRDIEDLSYEVIVVENGSDPDQRLGDDFVTAFGPEFRYVDLGSEAEPSPVKALNLGIQRAAGRDLALMIDGAHVLTPRVLHFGKLALDAYGPSLVATQQWYVGPGQQGEAMDAGYDQVEEDRLFEKIGWPQDGYKLFEIGHFVGERDWFDGLWESNCIFVPRSVVAQVGGFDPDFSMPGGGYANLDLWERLGSTPGLTVATIIGEGSFHQLHGGTTTNQPEAAERRSRVFGYGEHYAERRGRPFRGPGKPIHYVGHLQGTAAKRSKPRRMSAEMFSSEEALLEIDRRVTDPVPVPDDLRNGFTEAVWRTVPWKRTSWLGTPIETAPTDLLAYQEIIERVRPSVIVETGAEQPGRSLFLASICDLVGHGRVITVGGGPEVSPPHDRIVAIAGKPHQDVTVERVKAEIGDDPGPVVVVIGTCANRFETIKQFEAYSPLVGEGSYLVVTDTVVNGHPVWTGFGPGPAEAVKQIMARFGEWVPDPSMEKYSLTFNPNGFLRRVGGGRAATDA